MNISSRKIKRPSGDYISSACSDAAKVSLTLQSNKMKQRIWQILLLSMLPLWLAMGEPKDAKVEKAKALFNAASVYYNDKDYEKALAGYKDAYNTAPLPVILFNIAQCYRLLNRHQEALDAYRKFLIDDPKSQYRPEVEAKIKDLEVLAAAEKERLAQAEKERLDLEEKARIEQENKAKSMPATSPLSQPVELDTPAKTSFKPVFFYAVPAVALGAVSFSLRSGGVRKTSPLFGQVGLPIAISADVMSVLTVVKLLKIRRVSQQENTPEKTAGAHP
jgi:tetratricopeptide (TPR) repeat protein